MLRALRLCCLQLKPSGSLEEWYTERGFRCFDVVFVGRTCISTSFGVAGMLSIMAELRYVRCACVVFLSNRRSGRAEWHEWGYLCVHTEHGFLCFDVVFVGRTCISTSFGVAGMLSIMVELRYVRCACAVSS